MQVPVQAVAVKRYNRRCQHGNLLQALIKGLVCRQLVRRRFAAPVPFPVQPHVPVAQVFGHEFLDCPARTGGLVVLVILSHILYQRVEQRQYPPVYLRPVNERNLLLPSREAVDVGIQRKE